jgi:hypothetical protein
MRTQQCPGFGDSVDLRFSGLFARAVSKLCNNFQATITEYHFNNTDLVVTYDAQHGLTVDSRPVSVLHHLECGDRVRPINRVSGLLLQDDEALVSCAFAVNSFSCVFTMTITNPLKRINMHNTNEAVFPILVTHNPVPKLFSAEGAYTSLGAMGGLGEHLAIWIVRNGAKVLVTINRTELLNRYICKNSRQCALS